MRDAKNAALRMIMDQTPILELENVDTYYGSIQVLYDINIKVNRGELVCLLGGNASGKSTTLKTILGVCKIKKGCIKLNGERIDGKPTKKLLPRVSPLSPKIAEFSPE